MNSINKPVSFSGTRKQQALRLITIIFSAMMIILIWWVSQAHTDNNISFDGEKAYIWIVKQCDLGYRYSGSMENQHLVEIITSELADLGWDTSIQQFEYKGTTIRNVLAWQGQGPAVLLGAHYDTRRQADKEDAAVPVLGANDGASGVAVLLELARVIDIEKTGKRIYLAFFDAEDNGGLEGWDWIVGSSYMAEHWGEQGELPLSQVVIVDMIGDKDLNIYWDRNSDQDLSRQIWQVAHKLGFDENFILKVKYSIYDDHIPFKQMGIPAIDIIDFDYPYWHTTHDTPDKVSADSLEAVGQTLQTWLENP